MQVEKKHRLQSDSSEERKREKMLKEMKLKWKLWSSNKHKHLILKVIVPILLLGLAYRLLFSPSTSIEVEVSPIAQTNFANKTLVPNPATTSVDVVENGDEMLQEEKCDLFKGDWIPNPSGPVYTNDSCPLIESHQNCMKNGRPDSDYLYWRWNPRNCELPLFDAGTFLELMRNKTWALIGDSISRNHVQSLLCMLSKGEGCFLDWIKFFLPISGTKIASYEHSFEGDAWNNIHAGLALVEPALLVYHDEEYKSKRWLFPSHNFTVSVIWSPFLVKAEIFEDINGVSTSEVEMHLDKLDKKWTDLYQNLDYMIISSGKWFLKSAIYYESNKIMGCHNCVGKNLTDIGFDFAYRIALRYVLNYITSSSHKGLIFFRTSTPDHFENGEWFSGGTCQRKKPVKEGEIELKELNRILRDIELEEYEKAAVKASEKGVNLKLLDYTPLLLLRPDGHPGPYRHFQPFAKGNKAQVQNDCLHWCLPGPIDSWNDVLMEMVINS